MISFAPLVGSFHNATILDRAGSLGVAAAGRLICAIPALVIVRTEHPGSSAKTVAHLADHLLASCGPSCRRATTKFGPTARIVFATGSGRAKSSQISTQTESHESKARKVRTRSVSEMFSHAYTVGCPNWI
jgi:hypothetical protein